MLVKDTGWLSAQTARSIKARSPYLPFVDNFNLSPSICFPQELVDSCSLQIPSILVGIYPKRIVPWFYSDVKLIFLCMAAYMNFQTRPSI